MSWLGRMRMGAVSAVLCMGAMYETALLQIARHQHAKVVPIVAAPFTLDHGSCALADTAHSNPGLLVSYYAKVSADTLKKNGVDLSHMPTVKEFDDMVARKAPYVASVLRHTGFLPPRVIISDRDMGIHVAEYSLDGDSIVVSRIQYEKIAQINPERILAQSEHNISHEVVHSQRFSGTLGDAFIELNMRIFFRAENETRTQVAALEVLAREALAGDQVAFHTFNAFLSATRPDSLFVERDAKSMMYHTRPARIVFDAASCRISEYKGIRLNGVRILLERENRDSYGTFYPRSRAKFIPPT